MDVRWVREVLEYSVPQRLPDSPSYVLGIIDVRGTPVPVVDLRKRLGSASDLLKQDARILVLELPVEGRLQLIGALADAVHDVVELDNVSLGPPPSLGEAWRSGWVSGIGYHKEQPLLILDAPRIVAKEATGLARRETSLSKGEGDLR